MGHVAKNEREEQRILANWLNKHALWLHVPNEGRRSAATGALLRDQGLKAGAPDCLIFAHKPSPPPYHVRGWAIELKATDRGMVSTSQRRWLDDLDKAGWHTHVAYGAADAIAWLCNEWGIHGP